MKKFTLVLSNGKAKQFNTGYKMWQWAVNNRKGWEFNYDEKSGPFWSDYCARRHNKK